MSGDLLMTMLKSLALWLTIAGLLGLLLASMYRNNRLLFWCLAVALAAHVAFGGGLWIVSNTAARPEEERLLRVNIAAPPPVAPPKDEPLPPPPQRTLDLPIGRPDGDRDVTRIRKGSTLDPKARVGARSETQDRTFGNQQTMATATDGPGDVGYDPDASIGRDLFGPGDSLDVRDLFAVGRAGSGGDDWGHPDGDPDGGVPAGFAEGKVGGRVYFIRLKYGISAGWYAYNNGLIRLLGFLNRTFPCQGETWPMTAQEMHDRYVDKGGIPSFLYIYADDKFTLNAADVAALRSYMGKGGFLFIDSRPDPLARDLVARELDKVLPGQQLAPLTRSHPIYSFLYVFRETLPTGFNLGGQNYGISRGGRLVVFYTMGEFSSLYAAHAPGEMDYINAHYQMGANVMLYAITKGNPAGFAKQQGARAEVTTQTLERLGMLETRAAPSLQPGESVKVQRDPPPPPPDGTDPPAEPSLPDDPDEIRLLD